MELAREVGRARAVLNDLLSQELRAECSSTLNNRVGDSCAREPRAGALRRLPLPCRAAPSGMYFDAGTQGGAHGSAEFLTLALRVGCDRNLAAAVDGEQYAALGGRGDCRFNIL